MAISSFKLAAEPESRMEDAQDIGLQGVMGSRFSDCTVEEVAAIRSVFSGAVGGNQQGGKPAPAKPAEAASRQPKAEQPQEAKWEPVRGPRTELERLMDACRAGLPYSAACAVLWYWEVAGVLDIGVAQVASTACAVITAVAAVRGWYKP